MDCNPPRLLCPGGSPGKKTGAGCHFLLQGVFPTQGLNPHLSLTGSFFPLSSQGSPSCVGLWLPRPPSASSTDPRLPALLPNRGVLSAALSHRPSPGNRRARTEELRTGTASGLTPHLPSLLCTHVAAKVLPQLGHIVKEETHSANTLTAGIPAAGPGCPRRERVPRPPEQDWTCRWTGCGPFHGVIGTTSAQEVVLQVPFDPPHPPCPVPFIHLPFQELRLTDLEFYPFAWK